MKKKQPQKNLNALNTLKDGTPSKESKEVVDLLAEMLAENHELPNGGSEIVTSFVPKLIVRAMRSEKDADTIVLAIIAMNEFLISTGATRAELLEKAQRDRIRRGAKTTGGRAERDKAFAIEKCIWIKSEFERIGKRVDRRCIRGKINELLIAEFYSDSKIKRPFKHEDGYDMSWFEKYVFPVVGKKLRSQIA